MRQTRWPRFFPPAAVWPMSCTMTEALCRFFAINRGDVLPHAASRSCFWDFAALCLCSLSHKLLFICHLALFVLTVLTYLLVGRPASSPRSVWGRTACFCFCDALGFSAFRQYWYGLPGTPAPGMACR